MHLLLPPVQRLPRVLACQLFSVELEMEHSKPLLGLGRCDDPRVLGGEKDGRDAVEAPGSADAVEVGLEAVADAVLVHETDAPAVVLVRAVVPVAHVHPNDGIPEAQLRLC
eukprot:134779-Hanusia_phi.AAC.3